LPGVDVVEAVDGSAKELLKDLLGLEAKHVALVGIIFQQLKMEGSEA
jgi:hypothetical protein